VGRVWARNSARPGITEHRKADGPGIFPGGGEPRETRPFHAGKGTTERGLNVGTHVDYNQCLITRVNGVWDV
jgi:hypothetical protein